MTTRKLLKAVLISLIIAAIVSTALLFSGKRILVTERLVKPGDKYSVDEYGDLGKEDQRSLLCQYFTGRSILTRVFWYSPENLFGKDQCPFILNE
jgi:hypothetical protein